VTTTKRGTSKKMMTRKITRLAISQVTSQINQIANKKLFEGQLRGA
jgi:hypothetical protein